MFTAAAEWNGLANGLPLRIMSARGGAAVMAETGAGAMSEAHCAARQLGRSADGCAPNGAIKRLRHSTDARCPDARSILSTCAALSWPSGIDWQGWVGCDLNARAVVVAVISIPIEGVFTHPKEDLQRAFLAVDVGEAKVRLMKGARGWTFGVDEQPVRQ